MFYDGTKLLSLSDINGNKPEIYLCTSNRSAGKTTYFNRYVVNRFLKYGEKFCLIYRFNYELDSVADKFFKDISELFFTGSVMESKKKANGIYCELTIDGNPCGYAIALNHADKLKLLSHLLSDTQRMVFDEFQSESNHYCPEEIRKFISVHTSIARGRGKQVRYLPVFMIGNTVSIINPYYTALGISKRLKHDTVFLRGEGFVLEQGFVDTASRMQKESGFNRAFASNEYVAYASENVYLNDNMAFIECPKGKSRYICTLKYKGGSYSLKEFAESGIIFCDNTADEYFPEKIAVTTDDHNINYVMLKRNDFLLQVLRQLFEHGCFRFKDLKCKEAVLAALSF